MRRVVRLVLLGFSCTGVLASDDLSLFAGWTYVGSWRSSTQEINLKDFGALGVRYERSRALFGLENSLGYYTNPAVAADATIQGGIGWSGNLVVNLPLAKATPFLTVGLGLMHRFGESLPKLGTSFTTNYGFGLKKRNMAGPAGLRLDFRRITFHNVSDESVKVNELSAGLMLSF